MGETLLTLTIITLIILTIRRAKPAILDNPVTMHRPGKYHITLAAQLNRAQPFIENVAKHSDEIAHTGTDTAVQYFYVHDEKIHDSGEKSYLLAVATRGGMAYFQAIKPQSGSASHDTNLRTISEFADKVLTQYPATSINAQSSHALQAKVLSVAQNMHIEVEVLAGESSAK